MAGAEVSIPLKQAFEKHVSEYQARITNMKATLGHAPVAFDIYMQWYPLYRLVEEIVGQRMAYLYAYSISYASDCPLCSTFFRKLIIDAGERPEKLELSEDERRLVLFGSTVAKCQGHIADHIYSGISKNYSNREMVTLVAFAGQMIATNVFNNVIETDLDEYLADYLPPVQSIWKNA